MPLSVAMALSGLDRSQWGDFKELYDQGTKVMTQEVPTSSRSSSAPSSRNTSPSAGSNESGIGTLSPDPMVLNHPIPLTLRDYCLFKVEAMQKGDKALKIIEMFDLARKQKEGIKEEKKEEKDEQEKKEEKEEQETKEEETREEKEEEKPEQPTRTLELMWNGRNLLDLDANLRGNINMYVQAKLRQGVQSYFENRSQISRLQGAPAAEYKMHECSFLTCSFEEPIFY